MSASEPRPANDHPGVYISEEPAGAHSVEAVSTSVTAFTGRTARGPVGEPVEVTSMQEFTDRFGAPAHDPDGFSIPLGHVVGDFFIGGGSRAVIVRLFHPSEAAPAPQEGSSDTGCPLDTSDYLPPDADPATSRDGIYALNTAPTWNVLCIPPDSNDPDDPRYDTPKEVYEAAVGLCARLGAFLICDPPGAWSRALQEGDKSDGPPLNAPWTLTADATDSFAAVYFPRIRRTCLGADGGVAVSPACGMIAAVYAGTDATHGVWKAPAGIEASLPGAVDLEIPLDDEQNGRINRNGINCLRNLPMYGNVVWGARTLRGRTGLDDTYMYVSVRRLVSFIEQSLENSLSWTVFEPSDPQLWASVRRTTESFLNDLWTQGAFMGETAGQAYFVQCDGSTTPPADAALGQVVLQVGIAPLKPAEFIIIEMRLTALPPAE